MEDLFHFAIIKNRSLPILKHTQTEKSLKKYPEKRNSPT